MTNCQYYCWDTYDPWGFDCSWWEDTISRHDYREDVESLLPLRRAQSFLPGRVFKMRWFSSATGL